jgi:plastocyanin
MRFAPRRRPRILVTSLAVGALFLAACGGDSEDGGSEGSTATTEPSGAPVAATVVLQPATFKPAKVTIKPGETVRWKWAGGVQHDVEGDGFESEVMTKGQFEHTFDSAGEYPYKCNIHPTTMKGTVTVSG